jgi:hypothetical protein
VSIVDGPNQGRSTTTDASGSYSFNGLQRSGFTVIVSAANYISASRSVTLTQDQTVNFSLRTQPQQVTLTGRVTDAATGAPIVGAIVYINQRYGAPTDNSGSYSVTGLLDYGANHDYTMALADNYEADVRYIRGTVQNVRLFRIDRITAGASRLLTIAPDDTLCDNNVQDTPGAGPDYVCRSVRVVAPSDGFVTVEAVASDGSHPLMEVETVANGNAVFPLMNPATIQVPAGGEVAVNVEMPATSTTSQTFTVTTSISPRP